jgi:hypothetical protein
MNWYKKANLQYRTIPHPDDVMDEDDEYDADEARSGVEQIFMERGIRTDSTKEFTDVAMNDGLPVGGMASGWSDSGNYGFPVKEFSFDVATEDPTNRTPNKGGTGMMGMKLIQEGINRYEAEKSDWEEMEYKTMIRLWVVNPRLVPILERRFGFDIESEYSDGSAHMVRY